MYKVCCFLGISDGILNRSSLSTCIKLRACVTLKADWKDYICQTTQQINFAQKINKNNKNKNLQFKISFINKIKLTSFFSYMFVLEIGLQVFNSIFFGPGPDTEFGESLGPREWDHVDSKSSHHQAIKHMYMIIKTKLWTRRADVNGEYWQVNKLTRVNNLIAEAVCLQKALRL